MSNTSNKQPDQMAAGAPLTSEAPRVVAIGMASLFAATPIALVLTVAVIWQSALSWLWALPLYALIGAGLTLVFTGVTWLLMTSNACAGLRRRLPFMRQSS